MLYIYVEGNYVGGEGTMERKEIPTTMEQERNTYPPQTHQLKDNEGIVLSNICSYIQV